MDTYTKFLELLEVSEEDILSVEGKKPGTKLFATTSEYYKLLDEISQTILLYFTEVFNHTVKSDIVSKAKKDDTEKIQEEITKLDSSKTYIHNSVITSIKTLNRLCEAFGKSPIFELDTKNKNLINVFIDIFCTEVYMAGSYKSFMFKSF